jgi:conjugal transfer pilus assembly protein TrbC
VAYVEETQLLRTVMILGAFGIASAGFAQSQDDGPVQFAPGSDDRFGISIPDVLEDARRLGEAWRDGLSIQEPNDFARDYDIDAMRDRALSNPRVRALLNADGGGEAAQSDPQEQRYGSNRVFLMASFSMPDTVLRAMMVEAIALDVPIIFRGFVNNSVFDTQVALQQTFGDDADLVGFGIDPTLFTRFQIERVPTLIVVNENLDVCETQGCEEDVVPPHDRLAGNIPLRAALEIIAQGEGDARIEAQALLAAHPVLQ